RGPHSFPTRRSSDLPAAPTRTAAWRSSSRAPTTSTDTIPAHRATPLPDPRAARTVDPKRKEGTMTDDARDAAPDGHPSQAEGERSEEHTSELQSREK